MKKTQREGAIAVSQAIATFTRQGYDVLILLADSATYDLVVDFNDALVKYRLNTQV